MDIEIYKINLINTAISNIMKISLPVRTSWKIYKISSELADKMKFIISEEKKIIDNFSGTILDDGTVKFPDQETAKKASAKLNEFHNEILTCGFEKIEISLDDLENNKIEPSTFAALEEIIDFV